jgi:regulator of cell morphogenesis and NO signaling
MTHLRKIIQKETIVRDIVAADYRTADVFQKHGIEFCCGGKWPLETVCMMKGLEVGELLQELEMATRTIRISATLPFHNWNVDFIIDYIINIHHHYLQQTLPSLWPALTRFVEEHLKKDPRLYQLQSSYRNLQREMLLHLKEEEEVVFPYIRQLDHAYTANDTYAQLLVKTLRKSIAKMMEGEHEMVSGVLMEFRQLTDNYTPPEKACTSHRVILAKLQELDNDLTQHMHLENDILFPKALTMEKELLQRGA